MSTTRKRSERGQVLPLFVLSLVVLLSVAALVFDVGMVLVERRDQQNAADAAALAGARYVLFSNADAEAAARRIASLNGFDDAAPDQVVNVYIPPIHGNPVYRRAGFIEVEIQSTRPSIFAGIVGKDAWDVGVYAIATNRQDLTFPFSMLALDPTACAAIQVTGTGVIDAYANIQSNSNGADCSGEPVGLKRAGGSTINVYADDATCRSVGTILDQGSGYMTCTPAENSFALPDPLRNLPAPPIPALAEPMKFVGGGAAPAIPKNCPGASGADAPSLSSPVTCKLAPTGAYSDKPWVLYPGLYPGGLEITQGTTAHLMPGVYWIGGGGLRTATRGSVISVATEPIPGSLPSEASGGVLIYNSKLYTPEGELIAAGGPIVLDGSGATIKLEPLQTVPGYEIYKDIVVFQDRTLTLSVTLNGSASTTDVGGLIYVPGGQVKLNGNGGSLVVDQIIANTYLIDGGGGHITITRETGLDAIIVAAGLVE